MAVLLRAPANKAESWAKEFGRLDIPLVVERGGFFSSIEVLDLLNLFQILDNPLQDVPLLGVLHSPLVGMTIRELASVRLAALKGHFWSVLVRWADSQGPRPQTPAGKPAQAQAESEATLGKVRSFLERYARWRNLARQTSLSRCLENILAETHYLEWLLTQPRGEQRQANVQRLLRFAEQFDQFQRQGLFRFLRFIEARQKAEAEPEVPAVSGQNAVRLMSIHQSKGLEFPIVVAPDLGKRFNLSDLWSDIILDERYGLCPKVKSPETGKRYPSLPYWLARHRQTAELLGEEMRLFYVTMTRACDRLILSATVSKKRFEDSWRKPAPITPATLSAARSCADWLGIWAAGRLAAANGSSAGSQLFSWTLHDDTSLLDPAPDKVSGRAQVESAPDPAAVAALERRLAWQYPFPAVTRQPAKTSVSVVRRQAAQQDDELASLFAGPQPWLGASRPQRAGGKRGTLGATEIGDAHHLFLELVSLNAVGSVGALEREARRLVESKAITPEQHSALDLDALAAFWQSDLGRSICAHSEQVRRELPFTARFSANELETLAGRQPQPPLENEFVVVQGVADLAILGPSSIRLVDFKTDALKPDDLAVRARFYRPQLHLYALALARIYRRPVTDAWLYFLSLRTAVAVPLQ
jgi:ATP-dependent helicase/nuclease subunit A